jgi:hypothetical protein
VATEAHRLSWYRELTLGIDSATAIAREINPDISIIVRQSDRYVNIQVISVPTATIRPPQRLAGISLLKLRRRGTR